MSAKEPAKPLLSEPEEVALLKDIAEALNEANDMSSAMAAILPRLSRVLGLQTAWAFRFDPKRATFVEVGASGLPPALAANNAEALKSSWCECQDRLVNGRLDTAINIVRCSRLKAALGDKQRLEFHASIPMKMNGEPLGILNVAASGAQVFTGPALDLLRAIGYHVAVTMDRAALLADMRGHNEKLEALGEIARDLTGVVDQDQLFERAVRLFSDRMGFEGVAISEGDSLLHAAHRSETRHDPEYSYQDHATALLPAQERRILADACSVMSVPIPHFPYQIRVESRTMRAFSRVHEEILSAFAWHLTALLEQISLYRQALETARWAERRQLAADLHDSVSQQLFSAQFIARAIRQESEAAGTANFRSLTERLEAVIRQSQTEMRGLIEALRPESAPISLQLKHRLIRLHEVLGDRLSWNVAETSLVLPPRVADAMLRIMDEALQNSIKHGQGAPIGVAFREDRTGFQLSIVDQGPGFEPVSAAGGYGLHTMHERAEAVGLNLRLKSRPGAGTRITVSIEGEGTSRGG